MKKPGQSKAKNHIEEARKVMRLSMPIMLMAIGGGWVPDMIQSGISGEKALADTVLYISSGLILFLAGAYWAYRQRRDYLPCRVLDRIDVIKPRRVLVTTLSTRRNYELSIPDDENEPIMVTPNNKEMTPFELPGSIEEVIKPAKSELQLQWNWQQVLRAVHPHTTELKKVHVIGSSGLGGSFNQLGDCERLLSRYLDPDVEITCDPVAVDFGDIDPLTRHFKAVIKKLDKDGYPVEDIMIDTTGGMKTTSIAAAMVTLSNPALHFQYVPTDSTDFKPFSFNVVTESQADFG